MRYILRAIVIDPIIWSFTALMATISLACSLFDSTGRLQHECARLWARFSIRISGVKINVKGLENISPDKPYIFAANHQSVFDIWALLVCLPIPFRFVAKKSLFRWPFLGWHLRRAGDIPIDRADTQEALTTLVSSADKIRAGASVVVFPEGTRSADGQIGRFKKGPFLLAIKAGVQVVPVSISGSRFCLPKKSLVIRPGTIDVVIGEPIDVSCYGERELGKLANQVRQKVLEGYNASKPMRPWT